MPLSDCPRDFDHLHAESLRAILDSLDEGVLLLDDAGRLLDLNSAACSVLNVARHDVLRVESGKLLADRAGHAARAIQSALEGKPGEDVEIRLRISEGRERLLQMHVRPLESRSQQCDPDGILAASPGTAGRDESSSEACGPIPRVLLVVRDATEVAALRYALDQHGVTLTSIECPPERDDSGHLTPEAVREALIVTHWNLSQAARRLGVSRTALYKRVRVLKLQRPTDE